MGKTPMDPTSEITLPVFNESSRNSRVCFESIVFFAVFDPMRASLPDVVLNRFMYNTYGLVKTGYGQRKLSLTQTGSLK